MTKGTQIEFYKVPDALAAIEKEIEDSFNEQTGEFEIDTDTLMKQEGLIERAEGIIEWLAKKNYSLVAQGKAVHDDFEETAAILKEISQPYHDHAKMLGARADAIEKRTELNKELTALLFKRLNIEELVLPTGKKVWTQFTKSIEVDPEMDLSTWPPKYVTIKRTPNKKAIKASMGAVPIEADDEPEWSLPGVSEVIKETIRFPK